MQRSFRVSLIKMALPVSMVGFFCQLQVVLFSGAFACFQFIDLQHGTEEDWIKI